MHTEKNSNTPVPPSGGVGGYIYNVTIKVDASIKDEWLKWLKEVHLPEVINTGCFISATILQLLETDISEDSTFAIQYQAESKAQYNRYIEQHSATMRQRSFDRWGDKFIAFRSLLQVVN
jgi:Domain of unknown function (DUF4286)